MVPNLPFAALPLVIQDDGDATIQKGKLAQAISQHLRTKFQRFKNLIIR